MGIIYKASCPECGYETKFFLGGGMLSINLKRSASVLPEDEQEQIAALSDNDRIKDFLVENKMTECKGCKTMESRTIIDVTEINGKVHRFGDLCSRCNKSLIVYEQGAEGEYICPKCYQGVLVFSEEGLWD